LGNALVVGINITQLSSMLDLSFIIGQQDFLIANSNYSLAAVIFVVVSDKLNWPIIVKLKARQVILRCIGFK